MTKTRSATAAEASASTRQLHRKRGRKDSNISLASEEGSPRVHKSKRQCQWKSMDRAHDVEIVQPQKGKEVVGVVEESEEEIEEIVASENNEDDEDDEDDEGGEDRVSEGQEVNNEQSGSDEEGDEEEALVRMQER